VYPGLRQNENVAVEPDDGNGDDSVRATFVYGDTWNELRKEAALKFTEVLGHQWHIVEADIESVANPAQHGGKKFTARVVGLLDVL
jgi:hypothetical protein